VKLAPSTIEPPLEAAGVTRPIGKASPKNPKDGLDAFAAETVPLAKAVEWSRRQARQLIIGSAIAAVGIAAGASATVAYQRWFARTARLASLTIETLPSGLGVSIDGTSRGRTPLTLTLPPRAYEAVVGSGNDQRIVKATLAAGAAMVQRLELSVSPSTADVTHGILRVDTIPSALAITVDGTERGVSPLTLQNVTPGEHDVALASGRESLHRKVTVHGGETLSLLFTAAAPAPSSVSAGWVSVDAPVPLQIREEGKLLGSTESDRLLIAAGNHTLDFVNAELGFSQRLTVNVTPGKASTVNVKVPNGTLSLNAQPWAQVWVDGARVGETPIGNLVRPIGRHDVVFRHPELGERRETVMVTALQPTRLGVDLRRKSQ
jgi:hypothetical protein